MAENLTDFFSKRSNKSSAISGDETSTPPEIKKLKEELAEETSDEVLDALNTS